LKSEVLVLDEYTIKDLKVHWRVSVKTVRRYIPMLEMKPDRLAGRKPIFSRDTVAQADAKLRDMVNQSLGLPTPKPTPKKKVPIISTRRARAIAGVKAR